MKGRTGQNQDIAIKSLKPKMFKKFMGEFEREIKMMLKLEHNNIVKIIGQCPEYSDGKEYYLYIYLFFFV